MQVGSTQQLGFLRTGTSQLLFSAVRFIVVFVITQTEMATACQAQGAAAFPWLALQPHPSNVHVPFSLNPHSCGKRKSLLFLGTFCSCMCATGGILQVGMNMLPGKFRNWNVFLSLSLARYHWHSLLEITLFYNRYDNQIDLYTVLKIFEFTYMLPNGWISPVAKKVNPPLQ